MKKLAIYGAIVIVIFISLAVVTSMKQTKQAEGNPFGKSTLHPETIKLLDDPNYQNIILPEELERKLANKEDVTVYFYQSTCPYCKELTPRLVPLAEELGVDLVQYNLLEFQEGWEQYDIESTPTVVHFEDGKEKGRITGAVADEEFTAFFNEYVLK